MINSVSQSVSEPFLQLSPYFCLSICFSPQSKWGEKSAVQPYLLKQWILNLAPLTPTPGCHASLLEVNHTEKMTWTDLLIESADELLYATAGSVGSKIAQTCSVKRET